MASNKNQHFVPRCYLRQFSTDPGERTICLFNIDRKRFIPRAAIKHQCSRSYFYGEDLLLESALQFSEGAYATVVREMLDPQYFLTDAHRSFLHLFWLLQHLRTEAASRRAIEMTERLEQVVGGETRNFRLGIRDAVQEAMRVFVDVTHIVDDLKICLLRNRTSSPFFTSDDPAVLTNRWYLEDSRTKGASFGLKSAGSILLLPLSPNILCLGYDGDVYSIPHQKGWVEVRHDADVHALNQHQILNCRANIFTNDAGHAEIVKDTFSSIEDLRPKTRHQINYAVLDWQEGDYKRYRVVDRDKGGEHREALIHAQTIHPRPSAWPKQLRWRNRGFVFTNDTGLGYVRRAMVTLRSGDDFRKELARRR